MHQNSEDTVTNGKTNLTLQTQSDQVTEEGIKQLMDNPWPAFNNPSLSDYLVFLIVHPSVFVRSAALWRIKHPA